MRNLKNLLKKYHQLSADREMTKNLIKQTVKEVAGIDLDQKLIIFKNNNIIKIKTSPLIKGEIFIRRERILKSLKSKLPAGYLMILK